MDDLIPPMVEKLKADGHAYISNGALVVDVKEDTDKKELPPCIILKSDGAALYGTTDLATLVEREKLYQPDAVIYITDKRQELHFVQVFRAAKKCGLLPKEKELTFLGFGTVNGKDGKPFKTREGGVMRLETLISDAGQMQFDETELAYLQSDLQKAKRVVFLTDNCGEIVADKLFIKEIKKVYPQLAITVIVRGQDVLNDATMEDAKAVGLTDIVKVIGNGSAIAGNSLGYISTEAEELIRTADVVISKGQGNFESLNGCGLNIYYLFLCKCDWFVRRFKMKRLAGILINDRNLEK